MAEYFQFLGRRVTVRYRVGEILLSASGTFSADSGRSIFLEQHYELRGALRYFRWEIPYPYIYRIESEGSAGVGRSEEAHTDSEKKAAVAAAGESSTGAGSVLPFPHRSKTA